MGEGWRLRFFVKGDGQKTHSRAVKKDYENYITKKSSGTREQIRTVEQQQNTAAPEGAAAPVAKQDKRLPIDAEARKKNRTLFGQYNKYLPAKASCRALINLWRQKPGGVGLAEAVASISQAAWELGDYLFALDQQAGRAREDSFAAAFPISASNGAGSRIRFANQFVGDLRQPKQAEGQPKETKFNGLPAALKFMQCSDGKNPILELTTAGAEFALLQNPIFDGNQEPASRKFSDGEIEFLLAHVRSCVPEEISAYISVIDAITNGANTPDQVNKFLCERFQLEVVASAQTENEITKTFHSQTTGNA